MIHPILAMIVCNPTASATIADSRQVVMHGAGKGKSVAYATAGKSGRRSV